jgi:putative ABC transport system permease protein
VAEVCFSVVLLIGAGLLVRSFLRIQSVQLGFDPAGVAQFAVSLPSARYDSPDRAVQFYHELQTRLRGLPGIDGVSLAAAPPLTNNYIVSSFRRLDRPPPEPGSGMAVLLRVADPNYLRVLKMPLLAGRNFEPADRQGAPAVALISQAAAQKFWRGENPIGKQLRLGINFGYKQPEAVTIIGVTGDIKGLGLTMQPEAEVYVPFAQSGNSSVTVLFRTSGDIEALLTQARAELRRMDPNLAFIRPDRMTAEVARKLAAPRFYMMLLTGFALLAMALAVIGIYGVVAYMVAQRTREIGVRIALGAQVSSVVRLVLWQGLRPALAGVTAGVVVALAGTRVLETLLYEIAPRDPLTVVAVPVLVLAAVVLACVLPARRASKTPAAIALQAENG